MNIEPTRPPDHPDNWIGFEFELSGRPRQTADARGDLYGCSKCGRKSCRGRCRHLFEPSRDEAGIPY